VLRPNFNHPSVSQNRRNESLEEVKLKKRLVLSVPSTKLVSFGLNKDEPTDQPATKKSKTVNNKTVPKLQARNATSGFKQATLPFHVQQGVLLASGPKRTLKYQEK
jgi:hypothetical protein